MPIGDSSRSVEEEHHCVLGNWLQEEVDCSFTHKVVGARAPYAGPQAHSKVSCVDSESCLPDNPHEKLQHLDLVCHPI